MNHAFAFSAEAGPHFTDPRGMESWVYLVGWCSAEIVYSPEDGHQSQYSLGLMSINFIVQTSVVNCYATPQTE